MRLVKTYGPYLTWLMAMRYGAAKSSAMPIGIVSKKPKYGVRITQPIGLVSKQK